MRRSRTGTGPSFVLAFGLAVILAASGVTPQSASALAPTLLIDQIQPLVAATLAAEEVASAPIPADTDTPIPIFVETPVPAATPTVTLPAASEAECIPKGTPREVATVTQIVVVAACLNGSIGCQVYPTLTFKSLARGEA